MPTFYKESEPGQTDEGPMITKPYKRKGPGKHSESSDPITETVKEPRLSNAELQERLSQSGQALRQVEEQKELVRQAGEFDDLQRNLLQRLETSNAKEQYEAAFAEVQTSVASRHLRRTEVQELIAETDPVVNRIIQELDEIHGADIQDYQKLELAYRTWFHSGGQNRWQDGIPDTAQAMPDSLAEWLRCIGSDEKLQTISPYDDSSPLRKAVTGSVKFIYYNVSQLRRLQTFGLNRFANFGRK